MADSVPLLVSLNELFLETFGYENDFPDAYCSHQACCTPSRYGSIEHSIVKQPSLSRTDAPRPSPAPPPSRQAPHPADHVFRHHSSPPPQRVVDVPNPPPSPMPAPSPPPLWYSPLARAVAIKLAPSSGLDQAAPPSMEVAARLRLIDRQRFTTSIAELLHISEGRVWLGAPSRDDATGDSPAPTDHILLAISASEAELTPPPPPGAPSPPQLPPLPFSPPPAPANDVAEPSRSPPTPAPYPPPPAEPSAAAASGFLLDIADTAWGSERLRGSLDAAGVHGLVVVSAERVFASTSDGYAAGREDATIALWEPRFEAGVAQCEAQMVAANAGCSSEDAIVGPHNPDGTCVDGVSGEWCSFCESDDGCAALRGEPGGSDGIGATCATGLPLEPFDAHLGVSCAIIGTATLEASCEIGDGWDETQGEEGRGRCDLMVNLVDADAVVACRATGCAFSAGSLQVDCADFACRGAPGTAALPKDLEAIVTSLGGAATVSCVFPLEKDADPECELNVHALGAAIVGQCSAIRRCSVDVNGKSEALEAIAFARRCDSARTATGTSGLLLVAFGGLLVAIGAMATLGVALASPEGFGEEGNADNSESGLRVKCTDGGTMDAEIGGEGNAASAHLVDLCSQIRRRSAESSRLRGAKSNTDVLANGQLSYKSLSVYRRGGLSTLGPLAPPSGATTPSAVAERRQRYIVYPVSGKLPPASLCALMGPSGSGKTTLLNSLAGARAAGLVVRGVVRLGTEELGKMPRGTVGYAPQEDVLQSTLTPREAVGLAAAAALPSSTSQELRRSITDAALDALGLQRVAASRLIGSREGGGAGLSGGERKRVSVACVLAACPSAVLLDEPTSGLDAYAAEALVRVLASVARSGVTVLFSVHQPSSHVFFSLDHLTLLSHGKRLFAGSVASVAPHLAACQLPACPPDVSLADHMLYLTCTAHPALAERATSYSDGDRNSQVDGSAPLAPPPASSRVGCSARRQAALEIWRTAVHIARHPTLLRTQLGVSVGMGLVLGGAFWGVKADAAGFQNKAGGFHTLLTFFAFGGLSSLGAVSAEWRLFWREWHAGAVDAWGHVLVRASLELLLLRVLPSLVLGAIVYLMMGLRPEVAPFLYFEASIALANANAGLLCSAVGVLLHDSPGPATLLAVVLLLLGTLLAGFTLNVAGLPPFIAQLPRLSFFHYAYEAMLTTQLAGQQILIEVPGAPPVRLKAEVALDLLGLYEKNKDSDLVALCLFVLLQMGIATAIVSAKLRPPLATCRGGLARIFGDGMGSRRRARRQPLLRRSAGASFPSEASIVALAEGYDDLAHIAAEQDSSGSVGSPVNESCFEVCGAQFPIANGQLVVEMVHNPLGQEN